jgi:toxin HigB-1
VIVSFRHKGLKELFVKRTSRHIAHDLRARCVRRLDAIDSASNLQSLNLPGFDFYPLHTKPQRYSIHVNGPWCLTFEWENGSARRLDLEQYH